MTYIRPQRPKLFLTALLTMALLCPAQRSGAQYTPAKLDLIRDTEIENDLKVWMAPIFKVAGMDKDNVHIVLVQSPDINAFVAGGPNIFIYTGLIDKTKNPAELIGVMAHELGHIVGGHLIESRAAMERASYESILGMVLGMGAAIAGRDGGAAPAIIRGSSGLAANSYLNHSRIQESSADQAALRFFNSAGLSPRGLVSFFQTMASQDLLPPEQQTLYMRTHPFTRDRMDAAQAGLDRSPFRDKNFPEEWSEQHARIKAKLTGFVNPGQVAWAYEDRDKSIPAAYARAIAAYRDNHVEDALADIDALIKREPDNPYFQELKGQALMDFGRISDSLGPYKKAVRALPDAGLIRVAYGHALLESGDNPKNINEAINQLERASQDEPRMTRIYHLLATGYGRLGDENMAKLNLAEESLLQRRYDDAKAQAQDVVKTASPGTRASLRARDILSYVETKTRDDDDK